MEHDPHTRNNQTAQPLTRPLTPEEGGESEIPAERLQTQGGLHHASDRNTQKANPTPRTPRAPLTLRDNTVFIGKKNAMSYVLAVVSQFNQGSTEVKVKARGRTISSAVDVSQMVKNRFLPDLKITLADISTEEMDSEEGGAKRKVSSLTLVLRK